MKIICVTGAPGSDVSKVADIFFAAGVKAAQPLRQDASFTLASWHEKVIAASGSEALLTGPVRQPGRFWEQFATNLFMENMQQPQWGWADPRSVWLLDFWQEFEPNLHFVLVYTSPQRALAQALAAEREHRSDTATLMAEWEAHHKEILRFHHRNPTRTILVDAAECAAAPAALLDICATNWKIELAPTAVALSTSSVVAPLVGYLAEQLRHTQPELQALQQEIEASLQTLMLEANERSGTPELFAAVENYRQMRNAAGRAEILALQIDTMGAQFAATETTLKEVHAQARSESRSESEQMLLQMHQLQEEMERGFLRNKELEELKSKKKRTIDELSQRLAQSEATAATLRKELEAAKTNKSAEKEKVDALAALAIAKKDLEVARQDIKRFKSEYEAAKEVLKKELEAGKAHKLADKEKADTLATLTIARKDLDSARQDIKRLSGEHDAAKEALRKELEAARQDIKQLKGEQISIKEAHQENELLLVQLHQVQEELEHYFLEHKSAVKRNQELNMRWERLLARTPDYCDYASLELLGIDRATQRANWQFTDLTAAGRAYPELRFDTIISDGIAGLAFARNGKAPGGPEALDVLSASEWLLLPTLCRILNEALQIPVGSLTQLGPTQRTVLIDALGGLADTIDTAPAALRFDRVTLKREQINPDYEHLWLQVGNLSMGEKRWGDIDFRLSCANVRPGKFGAHPKLEFPGEAGSALLESWSAESFDDFGDKLELRFALPEAMDMSVWEKLSRADQAILKQLVASLPVILLRLDDGKVRLSRPFADWQLVAGSVQSILAARTVAAESAPKVVCAPMKSTPLQAVEAPGMDMIQKGFI